MKIADSYDRQAQRDLKMVVSLLEPMMILIIGAILGVIVISIMLPIFEINQLMH
jgi:type II secretory pathway component PulF